MQSAVYFNESYNQLQPITCKYNDYILFIYIYIHVDCEHCGCLRDVVATTQAEKKVYGCVYIYIYVYIYTWIMVHVYIVIILFFEIRCMY